MKIEERILKTIDGKDVVQITTLDERWYKDENGIFRPSLSWIASYVPASEYLIKWIAETGWEESQKIRNQAGVKGSKVHAICDDLLKGKDVKMTDQYLNTQTNLMEDITVEEWNCAMTFTKAWKDLDLKMLMNEYSVIKEICEGEDPNYINRGFGGTVDIMAVDKNGQKWIIDIKTSKSISPEHILQISGYKHAHTNPEEYKIAVLQVGYTMNKAGWKFTEIEDKYDLLLSAKKFWRDEYKDIQPLQKDYPLLLSLN